MSPAQTTAFLSALSSEFGAMTRTVDGLSGLVMEHARQVAPGARPEVLVQAQAVDALSQALDALRGLTESLARGEGFETALDAVLLADLSTRLRQALPTSAPPSQPVAGPAAGDLMLFD